MKVALKGLHKLAGDVLVHYRWGPRKQKSIVLLKRGVKKVKVSIPDPVPTPPPPAFLQITCVWGFSGGIGSWKSGTSNIKESGISHFWPSSLVDCPLAASNINDSGISHFRPSSLVDAPFAIVFSPLLSKY